MGNEPMEKHWEKVYASKEITKMGWYEEVPVSSLRLLERCEIAKCDGVMDVGAGASVFIDHLIDRGFRNIIALDISGAALEKMKERLGEEKAAHVKWIAADITDPTGLSGIGEIALWHDRAMLHFLLEESGQQAYISALRRLVKNGGYVIIGVFSLDGAGMCSGLKLKNYSADMLSEFLGGEFDLLESFNYIHNMPSGDPRPYIYTLFQRNSKTRERI